MLFYAKISTGVDSMENISKKVLKRSQLMYVFEATFEYLVSILVGGTFLATITKNLGLSDSLTGILSSIISLGCLFQLTSVFIKRQKLKSIIVTFSVINQLLFASLYVIPLFNFSKTAKTIIFVVAIVLAYLIYNIIHPKKIGWMMSVVDYSNRGNFTAKKEMTSLIFGMIFSYSMGSVVDYFKDKGEIRIAFTICAIVISSLMVLHTISMLLTVEIECSSKPKINIIKTLKAVLSNKKILSVAVLSLLYNVAGYSLTPFLGTYKINELGFSLQFASFLGILSSLSRCLVSIPWGKYADKTSFDKMIEKCFCVLSISYLFVVFSNPKNGVVMLSLYYIFHGIALGGVNSALVNLIFDYAPEESRADSLAVCQALSGIVGFLTTLILSPVISIVQSNGNKIFGITAYAQPILAIISTLLSVIAVFYVRKFLIKKD